jgi:hypothetical protein
MISDQGKRNGGKKMGGNEQLRTHLSESRSLSKHTHVLEERKVNTFLISIQQIHHVSQKI